MTSAIRTFCAILAQTRCFLQMDDDDTTYTPAKRDMVAGLDKGLQVIEAFDQERSRLTIAEVAERTGLTRAAARRYLLTLTALGYMRHENKQFSLTPKVLRPGTEGLSDQSLTRIGAAGSILHPATWPFLKSISEPL